MSWILVDNPAYAGQQPRPLGRVCHDGSPFITIRCDCGADMHLHETQIAATPADAAIVTACKGCGDPHVFEPGWLQHAFAQMREQGWIE